MKRSLTLSLCAIALVACTTSSVRADEINIDLEFDDGVWSLFAEVLDTAGAADGSLGISAIRALIDNVDFGTDGDAVTIAGGIGAINPVPTSSGDRAPVLQLTGGTLDILFGQDISSAGSIVGGVGVGARALIASGTYSGVSNPAFGSDGSLTSQGLFLTSTTPGGGNAIDPDDNNLSVTDVGGVLVGDANDDSLLNSNDILPFVQALTDPTGYQASFPGAVFNAQVDANGDTLLNSNDIIPFVNIITGQTSGATVAAVPEPTSVVLACFAVCMSLTVSRRRA